MRSVNPGLVPFVWVLITPPKMKSRSKTCQKRFNFKFRNPVWIPPNQPESDRTNWFGQGSHRTQWVQWFPCGSVTEPVGSVGLKPSFSPLLFIFSPIFMQSGHHRSQSRWETTLGMQWNHKNKTKTRIERENGRLGLKGGRVQWGSHRTKRGLHRTQWVRWGSFGFGGIDSRTRNSFVFDFKPI